MVKKNNDKRTCIVVPLTSKNNGEGVNKINIGHINTLPLTALVGWYCVSILKRHYKG